MFTLVCVSSHDLCQKSGQFLVWSTSILQVIFPWPKPCCLGEYPINTWKDGTSYHCRPHAFYLIQ